MIQEKDYVKEAIELKIKLTRSKQKYEQKIASLEREIERLRHEIKHPFKPLMVDAKLERVGLFLNRHHSTIIHGANRINDAIDLKFNPELRIYENCMQELRSMSSQGN